MGILIFVIKVQWIGYWSQDFGFLENIDQVDGGSGSMKTLDKVVNWPGPRVWTKPNNKLPMRIGVPGRTSSRIL